jgi:hypothetical protein
MTDPDPPVERDLDDVLAVDVGGVVVKARRGTWMHVEGSMLASMFRGLVGNSDEVFLDEDAKFVDMMVSCFRALGHEQKVDLPAIMFYSTEDEAIRRKFFCVYLSLPPEPYTQEMMRPPHMPPPMWTSERFEECRRDLQDFQRWFHYPEGGIPTVSRFFRPPTMDNLPAGWTSNDLQKFREMLIYYGVELGVYRIGIMNDDQDRNDDSLLGWFADRINTVNLPRERSVFHFRFVPLMDELPSDSWTVKSFAIQSLEPKRKGLAAQDFSGADIEFIFKDKEKVLRKIEWSISSEFTYIEVHNFGENISTDGEIFERSSEDNERLLKLGNRLRAGCFSIPAARFQLQEGEYDIRILEIQFCRDDGFSDIVGDGDEFDGFDEGIVIPVGFSSRFTSNG